MLYFVFPTAFVLGAGFMFVAATNYRGMLTKNFDKKRSLLMGIRSVSNSVTQLRVWIFLIGAGACAVSGVGFAAYSANTSLVDANSVPALSGFLV